ncbi:MAG: undecaprenyl-diphosphate phosphatase [Candidatus Omnitrophica bacterium]|nr:undecaprenyl-diphosphate phosphatase [Candidatus Omnitrophota bacterium]
MLKYIILGIVQGLTEFLPVSSSGHLVILQKVFGLSGQEIAVTVAMHLGTAIATTIFFFKDILAALKDKRLILFIIIVTAVTGVIGLGAKDFFESLFSSVVPVALALFVTAMILFLTKKVATAKRAGYNIKDALFLGLAQGVAIIPGISRSGITISALLFRKIDRETSFKLSFLVSLPAIFGAALLEARKITSLESAGLMNLAAGFIASLLTGIIALSILRFMVKKAKLHYFGYYCIIIAVITLLFIR